MFANGSNRLMGRVPKARRRGIPAWSPVQHLTTPTAQRLRRTAVNIMQRPANDAGLCLFKRTDSLASEIGHGFQLFLGFGQINPDIVTRFVPQDINVGQLQCHWLFTHAKEAAHVDNRLGYLSGI